MSKPSALSAFAQAIVCGALILFIAPLPAAGQNPEPEKTQGQGAVQTGSIYVYRQPRNFNDPVRIIKMTEGSDEIVQGVFRMPESYVTPGQPIPANDDWIKDLSITFKNLTSLKIEFMQIDFSFLYGEELNFHHSVSWSLGLGQVPPVAASTYFNSRPGLTAPRGTGIPLEFGPGEEITIALSEGYVDKIQARIEAKTPITTVTRCVIGIGSVYFDKDGLTWGQYGSGWRRMDPNSPKGYISLQGFFPGDLIHGTVDSPPHQ